MLMIKVFFSLNFSNLNQNKRTMIKNEFYANNIRKSVYDKRSSTGRKPSNFLNKKADCSFKVYDAQYFGSFQA